MQTRRTIRARLAQVACKSARSCIRPFRSP
jgi:hypothetical protein